MTPSSPQPSTAPPTVALPPVESGGVAGGTDADHASGGEKANLPALCVLPTSPSPVPSGSDVPYEGVTVAPPAQADDPDQVIRVCLPADKSS